jgi:phosphatidylglycerol:prolipoprotein diacylglycerol transferase
MSGNKPDNTPKIDRLSAVRRWMRYEPYWYLIFLLLLVFTVLYIYHLATGQTPSRSAVTIAAFDLEIYWYGIIIISGVALGTFVVSRLALDRAKRIFNREVPEKVKAQPINSLDIPANFQKTLTKHKVERMGELLFQWGLHPERLGLDRDSAAQLKERLNKIQGVKEIWLEDAPWRIWNPDYAWNGVVVCLIVGIIGARLYHVFTPSPEMAAEGINSFVDYFRQPEKLVNLRNGGLGIYGGIAGGLLGLLWYTRRNRLPTIGWADLSAVGVALGQFVGRWGNFINQELYGRPTTVPWAVHIDDNYRLPGYIEFETFHPAFLYESIWNLLSFFVLYFVARRYYNKLKPGDLVAIYLIQYGVGRILLEFVRLDSRTWAFGGLEIPVASAVSLAIVIPMAVLLVRRHVLK